METQLIDIISLILFLFLSAFFSGSETALFSLKRSDLHRLALSELPADRNVSKLMEQPQKILITILLGNLFVNLIVSALSTRFFLTKWGNYGHFISIAIVTPVMIFFCEISPKVIAINAYETFARKVVPFLRLFHYIFYPLRTFVLFVSNISFRILGLSFEKETITVDELGHAVHLGEKEGVLKKEEGVFLKNIIRFSKKDAENVMFPRNTAFFIPQGISVNEAVSLFLEAGVIRAPVYKDDLDHVVGMIDSRELIPYYLGYKKAGTINKFITPVSFFPASRDLNDLLHDFLNEGIQMAILVDEFGGTAGVVTLNIILSELMGRDFNKWETNNRMAIKWVDANTAIIPGDLYIEDYNFYFHEKLKSENAETIAGYVIEQFTYFPKKGEVIKTGKHVITVRNIKKNRIVSLDISKRS